MTWWKRLKANPVAIFGASVLILLYTAVIFADWIAPYGIYDAPKNSALLPPSAIHWRDRTGRYIGPHVYPTTQGAVDINTGDRALKIDYDRPSPIKFLHAGHLFTTDGPGRFNLLGTDNQGRDQFTRLLYGGRVSLFVGFLGTMLSFAIGCLVGAISGYFGGTIDAAIMRLVEVLMSIPSIYLLMSLAAVLEKNPFTRLPFTTTEKFFIIVLVISLVGWAGLARVIRGQVLAIKEQPFVTSARAIGAGPIRIVLKHVLPQTATYLVISATLAIPGFIVAESVLSLIGLGIEQPDPSWGNMLSIATDASAIVLQPWLIWSPATLLVLTVLSFNLLGDGLRDALDPRNLTR